MTRTIRQVSTNLAKNIEKIEGQQNIKLSELCPPHFMQKHTNHTSIENMLHCFTEKYGITTATPDFLITTEWQAFAKETTSFESWRDMLVSATKEHFLKKLLG